MIARKGCRQNGGIGGEDEAARAHRERFWELFALRDFFLLFVLVGLYWMVWCMDVASCLIFLTTEV